MESYVVWLIMGLALIAAELVTGTFFLLVLGVAALTGSLAAYFGADFFAQAVLACVVCVAGVFMVNHWRNKKKDAAPGSNNIDYGQSVVFESWRNESARIGRVQYRGASWDAHVLDGAAVQANDVLYICGTEGAQLQVSQSKPKLEKGRS